MAAKIDLYYINLDRATERRAAIEKSILTAGFSDRWSFFRLSAVSAESELVRNTPGRNSDAYKGNFHSHMQCVMLSLQSDAHLFVAEDDAMFCSQTGPLVERIIDGLPEDSWDVIRTEVALISAADIPKLYKLCISDVGRSKVRLLDLGDFPFPYAGACAYIVNRRSKRRFINAMRLGLSQNGDQYDAAYDGYLHDLVQHRLLRGFLTVPFLTAPSFDQDNSQAPQMYADRPLTTDEITQRFNKAHRELQTAFRRLIWVGFTPDTVLPAGYEAGNEFFRMTEQDRLYQKIASWFLLLQGNIPYVSDQPVESFAVDRPVPGWI